MIKLLDKLVYREIIWPWIFGVAMFSVVLMAATYLLRLTDFVVQGVDLMKAIELGLYYSPALIAKTFPMSVLLASLLALARLSNDFEIVAAQASGVGLLRIMRPVALFGFAVSALTFTFGELLVPRASLAAVELQESIIKQIRETGGTPFSQPIYINNKLSGGLMARDINLSNDTMFDVDIFWYSDEQAIPIWFHFERLYYSPDREWRFQGGSIFQLEGDEILMIELKDGRPPTGSMPPDFSPKDLRAALLSGADAYSIADLADQIKKLKENPRQDKSMIATLEVGYWTKISIPLSGLVFALVGAPVAIRRVRQSIGVGVATSVVVIFVYYILHNYLTKLAEYGSMNPILSAFTPVALGLFAAAFLILQKVR